jgi:hypothetical protein
MAEEEKIKTDIEDWLNDLDEGENAANELSQADIDNLLGDSGLEHPDRESSSMEEGTIDQTEMDKLFGNTGDDALHGEDVDFVEIPGDQGDMAPLPPALGEDGSFCAGPIPQVWECPRPFIGLCTSVLFKGWSLFMAEEEKVNTDIDDWLNDLDEDEDVAGELDQADIDNLLGGDMEIGEDAGSGPEEFGEELDQVDIDNLLGDSGLEHPDRESSSMEEGTIDQTEMDKLFGNTGDDAPHGEDVDFVEIPCDQGDMALPLPDLGEDGSFDAALFTKPAVDEKTVLQSQPFPVEQATQTSVATKGKEQSPFGEKELAVSAGSGRRPFYRSRPFQMFFVVLLVLLLSSGAYYFLFSTEEQSALVLKRRGNDNRITAEAVPVQAPNRKPNVADNLHQMPPDGGEVAVKKQATDQDGTPSNYQVEEQTYGGLSGEAPNLAYLPNGDFSDRGSFSNQVQDDKNPSDAYKAVLQVSRSDPTKDAIPSPEKKEEEVAKEQPAVRVSALDASLVTKNSEPLTIDWLYLWKQAGNGKIDSSAGVEIQEKALEGKLERMDEWHSIYQAPKFFEGKEELSFRFKKEKKYSARRLLTISVLPGDHGPEIHIAPLLSGEFQFRPILVTGIPGIDDN